MATCSNNATSPEEPKIQFRGLKNRGQMCYIHVILQSLNVCLIRGIVMLQSTAGSPDKPVINALAEFFTWSSGEPTVAKKEDLGTWEGVRVKRAKPKKVKGPQVPIGTPFEPCQFYEIMPIVNPYFSVHGEQEDAEEFLSSLLNKLHDEAKWGEFVATAPSPIQHLVFGELKNTITDRKGVVVSVTEERFVTLPLGVDDIRIQTIQDAFDVLASAVELEEYAEGAVRKTTFTRLPTLLMVHLKRFTFDSTRGLEKIHKRVKFGFKLTLQRSMIEPSPLVSPEYELISVIYHHGATGDSGHYSNDSKDPTTGKWIRFDDAVVKALDATQVTNYPPGKTPYVLFYSRV
ncbi:ubiquitin carboxyl-terminal hydrolase 10-A-like [Sycon ciliatum]|uniref:ubiquitin carboxyl-terminal hydrolase 10-A-like n=1 Tax=Sycon ciliatum TaxID=27933 RepID=UPI0031F6E5BB